jgi:hypothetical protein
VLLDVVLVTAPVTEHGPIVGSQFGSVMPRLARSADCRDGSALAVVPSVSVDEPSAQAASLQAASLQAA